jgi:nitrate reductase delta subunit
LTYPQADLLEHMDEMKTALTEEGRLKGRQLKPLLGFMDALARTDLLVAQENYVETFDRGRAHCLHLFEHVHGESRFRGQALVELSERYAEKGLYVGTSELPDFLPLFLEFASVCDPKEAKTLVGQAAPVIATIGEKLKGSSTGYHTVMDAIVALSGIRISKAELKQAAAAAPPDIQTLDDLDAEWQEPDAFDGAPDCGSCGSDSLPIMPTSGGVR